MSDWKARGQKRASSSQSTVVAGKRKRSRTMMSSEEEEEEWSEGDEELMMSQIQTQDMDEVGEEKPVFTGQVSRLAGRVRPSAGVRALSQLVCLPPESG
jgi:hypothetical protein